MNAHPDKVFSEKTVLLTGAGGPAPAGMIDSLRKWGYRIVCVDMLPHSSAFYLADAAYVVPPGKSKDFLPRLREICAKEKVSAVVSVVDEELPAVLSLEADGIQVIEPRLEFVNLCLNKYECMRSLREKNIPAAETWRATEIPDSSVFPLFLKPATGRGSRGIGRVSSRDELETFLKRSSYAPEELIAQPFLPGTEFTVSVVVWRDGEVQAVVPKEIISKAGVTRFAVTRNNQKIHDLCVQIQETFRADGPFNVQLRLDDLDNPIPFEINPRFSTSITLTTAAGVDELGGLVTQALFGREACRFGKWREGVVMIRETRDRFISESDFKAHPVELYPAAR